MTLTPKGYIPRLIDAEIERGLKTFGSVSIEGPKWCGKTWSARNKANSEIQIDTKTKKLLETDSSFAFVGEKPHLIDEWQSVAGLWDDIRFEIDKKSEKGRFILCGSSTPVPNSKMHSGAGRIMTLKMHTMSLFETGDSNGQASLIRLFDGTFEKSGFKEMKLDKLIKIAIRGGWPGLVGGEYDCAMANRDYIEKICENAKGLDGVQRNPRMMRNLIRSLARNESTVSGISTIRKDMKEYDDEDMGESSISQYLGVLESLNVISYQPSFDPYVRSPVRVGKKPKRHLVDPSLAMAALGLTEKTAKDDLETFGFVFESLCEHDLEIYAEFHHGHLYHYRDNSNNEIDAIVELPDGRWGAFEIKLGFNSVDEAAKKLIRMNEKFKGGGKQPTFLCVICGMSSAAYLRPDGVYVVPITMLGP